MKCGSGLTANCPPKGDNQNNSEAQPQKSDTTHHHEEKQRSPEVHLHGKQTPEVPMDMHHTCKANDKENENANSNHVDSSETAKKVVEAPPPKVNPWTKKNTGRVSNNTINSCPQEKEQPNPMKVIRAGKPRPRKISKSSDFSDITNWPTPGELANEGRKPAGPRRDRDRKQDRSETAPDGSESKENQQEPLGAPSQDREGEAGEDTPTAALKKRGGEKHPQRELTAERVNPN